MLKQQGSRITRWYKNHHRDLPWRNTKDPYLIWVSEIILQQTRVDQGLPYYTRFIHNFPTLRKLAEATEDNVLHLWQGLGYYSRARNMHATAKTILKQYQGIFPSKYEEIRSLKGIGDYTAAAIASFAYDLPYPAVDGNVFRVVTRLNGIYDDISKLKTRKTITALAFEMMENENPALFNQSMMEFGATLCKPKQPLCEKCPLQDQCFAFRNDIINELPVKNNKIKVKNRFFHYLVINGKEHLYIKQRVEKDIWQNLWDLPLIESSYRLNEIELLDRIHSENKSPHSTEIFYSTPEIKHKLSHQLLHITFHFIDNDTLRPNKGWKKISFNQISEFAFPEIINKYKNEIMNRISEYENNK